MENVTIIQQRPSEKIWKDEAGNAIPYNRITASERLMEKMAAQLANKALKLHDEIKALKDSFRECSDKAYAAFLLDNVRKAASDAGKGNYTWYNFDRSIKIEVDVKDRIAFDEMYIAACKEKLMDFIGSNITGSDEFIKGLVLSAFETSRGRLDVKKILSLKSHASRIKDKRYHEAMDLLDKAIRRPDSKVYFRIWIKDVAGEYQNVDLNIASI